MRFRYILSGGVKPNDRISDCRLIAGNKLQGFHRAIRIELSNEAILEKYDCDEYSTWNSKNEKDFEIRELNPKLCLKINGEWQVIESITQKWINGQSLSDAINHWLDNKMHKIAILHLGYVTKEQRKWYEDNELYAWRLDRIPSRISNVAFPKLTEAQIETLLFVRGKFLEYYKWAVDNIVYIKDGDREEYKEYLLDFINKVSDDELAFEWHVYSKRSLDDNKRFETTRIIDRIKNSKYGGIHPEHYKYAIKDIVKNIYNEFRVYKIKCKHNSNTI